jgi:hypothetical protein
LRQGCRTEAELNFDPALDRAIERSRCVQGRADDLGGLDEDEDAQDEGERRHYPADVVRNAPAQEDAFFMVPKVVE